MLFVRSFFSGAADLSGDFASLRQAALDAEAEEARIRESVEKSDVAAREAAVRAALEDAQKRAADLSAAMRQLSEQVSARLLIC